MVDLNVKHRFYACKLQIKASLRKPNTI